MQVMSGYPTSWGNKRVSVVRVVGPSSYTQYTAPSTGGQDLDAVPHGVKSVDVAFGGVSDDGTHRVEVVQIEAGPAGGQTVARCRIVLKWYVVATGAEAASMADLDGQTASVLLVGTQ